MKTLVLALAMILAMVVYACAAPTVQVTPNGIAWTTPATNTDGSALIDLAGYKVYWSNTDAIESFTDNNSMDVKNVNAINMSALGLSKGISYCMAVTAYNILSIESAYSNRVCKIDPQPLRIPNNPIEQ